MKTICAWCKRVIQDGPEETHSHGICPVCARVVMPRQKTTPPAPEDQTAIILRSSKLPLPVKAGTSSPPPGIYKHAKN